jgi:nitrile hydratase
MTADHHHPAELAPVEARVAAIESVLVEKGIIDPDALDAIVQHFEENLGPMNGAKVVARAWTDPAYKERLLADATAAIKEFGFEGPEGELMVVVENTPTVHNLVVCTLCSCYPWPTLGLPPKWYKAPAYRSRAVREPRTLLAEMARSYRPTSRSGCGIPAPKRAILCCRCGPTGRRTCPRSSSPGSSPAIR